MFVGNFSSTANGQKGKDYQSENSAKQACSHLKQENGWVLNAGQRQLLKKKILNRVKIEENRINDNESKDNGIFLEEEQDLMKRWVDQKVVGMRASEKYKQSKNDDPHYNNGFTKITSERSGRSIVWDVFEVNKLTNQVRCALCGSQYNGIQTNTMQYHIKSQHQQIWQRSRKIKTNHKRPKPKFNISSSNLISQGNCCQVDVLEEGVLSFTPLHITTNENKAQS